MTEPATNRKHLILDAACRAIARTGAADVRVADVRWLRARPAGGWPLRCAVQIRHHAAALPAWIAGPAGDAPTAVTVERSRKRRPLQPGPSAREPRPGPRSCVSRDRNARAAADISAPRR